LFDEAIAALQDEGARPMLAICDYDEALMFARRTGPGTRIHLSLKNAGE